MSSSSLRDPRGQASVEWLAVVVVVATLLGLGAALAQAGYVGRRVTREMARAICLVGDGDGRPPDATSGSGTWTSSSDADVSAELAGQTFDVARAGTASDSEVGWWVDQRTGHRTAYVEASSSASATMGGGVLGLSSADAQERYAVEYDASGRPVDLRVIATGPFGGSRDLPAVVQPVAGLLARGAADGARGYEVTGHLDLTDAGNLAAARGLLNAIAGRQATAAPAQALRRRIDERGTLQARVLTTRTDSTGAGFDTTFGPVHAGAKAEIERTSQQLVAATSRGLDGQWITRTDCVA